MIQLPILIFLGLSFSIALGLGATIRHLRSGTLNLKFAVFILCSGITGVVLGGLIVSLVGILNGSLTSGTGLFITLWLVSWFGQDYKTAVAYTNGANNY